MSIRPVWLGHVSAKRLHVLDPFPGDRKLRTVLMSEEINQLVSGRWEDNDMGIRCAKLRARLQRIARGDLLVVCMEPFEAGRRAEIGRLDPPEDSTFDVRDNEKPGLRVFFRFAEKDVLATFVCAPRSVRVPWLQRLPLRDRNSREWRWGVEECKRQWSQLFPAHDPVKGENLDEYLSNAVLE
jgi:hypothetical protein